MFRQQCFQHGQIAIAKGDDRAGQCLGHADRFNAGKGIFATVGVNAKVGGLIPIMPAMIATDQNFVRPVVPRAICVVIPQASPPPLV